MLLTAPNLHGIEKTQGLRHTSNYLAISSNSGRRQKLFRPLHLRNGAQMASWVHQQQLHYQGPSVPAVLH